MSASPLELHAEEPERLNLMPFRQSIAGCLATLGRETVETIDRVVTASFCSVQRFSHSADEPEVIQSIVFAASAACVRGT